MSSILEEQHESFAIVRLNRPEKLNALSREMILALSDLFKTIDDQPNIRAIILTGEGDAFCSGTDISDLTGLDKDRARDTSERGQALCNQIEDCHVPVIAAIRGIAAGGGCELALACHIRIASTNARSVCLKPSWALFPLMEGPSGSRARLVMDARWR
jgi:enoyl-CoA hydratase